MIGLHKAVAQFWHKEESFFFYMLSIMLINCYIAHTGRLMLPGAIHHFVTKSFLLALVALRKTDFRAAVKLQYETYIMNTTMVLIDAIQCLDP